VTEIQSILKSGDSFAAMEHIQGRGTPLEIASRYASLVLDHYWKAHDLPAVITIGRAGILYCLTQSIASDTRPESVEKLRSIAKSIAYNVGSFAWPGWEEPGINPSADDLAAGRDCARLNLRLAIELKKPPKPLSMAHWLIGAYALAFHEFELAEKEFLRAQDVLPANDPAAKELEPCNLGYLAVARLCKRPTDVAAEASFENITGQLKTRKDEDAQVYLTQLLAARRLFVPH
jgi:hypothetical protein